MLRRVNAALFRAPAGAEVRVVARSQANNGVQDARFEYANTVLDRETIQGMPGCRFTVDGARRQLQAIVAFDPGASGNARYDLFEVEPDGGLTDLEEFVKKSDSSPLIDFVIEGVGVPAVAGPVGAAGPAGMARATAARRSSAPARRRKTAKRAAKKGAAKRTRKAAATRKTSRPKAKSRARTKARKTGAAKKTKRTPARARTRRRTRS
jgi:hypothetical protein